MKGGNREGRRASHPRADSKGLVGEFAMASMVRYPDRGAHERSMRSGLRVTGVTEPRSL